MRLTTRVVALAALGGCGHSDAFVFSVPAGTPPAAAADIRLTYNADQDYWPTWTQDGRGILYSFVDPGATVLHRCIGVLPAGGGQRLWQLCDNRATQIDSVSSFSGYALDSAGQLLYAEAVSGNAQLHALPETTLWLADTATPFARTPLLTLPVVTGVGAVTWLTEIRWTGANTFTALGQLFETVGHCFANDAYFCPQQDSIFFDRGMVVTGTIASGRATLQAISGTDGATSYSPAEGGASVVFTRIHDLRVWKVPTAGGTATSVATIPQGSVAEILGVSCLGTTCVVASAPVFAVRPEIPASPHLNPGTARLDAVSLATGAIQTLQSNTGNAPTIYSTPQLSPSNGDVVIQVGGTWWGHLQTFYGGGNGDLHLYRAIVH